MFSPSQPPTTSATTRATSPSSRNQDPPSLQPAPKTPTTTREDVGSFETCAYLSYLIPTQPLVVCGICQLVCPTSSACLAFENFYFIQPSRATKDNFPASFISFSFNFVSFIFSKKFFLNFYLQNFIFDLYYQTFKSRNFPSKIVFCFHLFIFF